MSFSEYRNSTQFQIDKNQNDRNSMNPAEFFGTNEFGDNSGSSTVDDSNNADVNQTNDNRGTKPPMMLLPNGQVNPLWSERYGTPETAPDRGDITADPEDKKEDNRIGIKTKPFGKYSTRRQGGVLRYPLELMTQETDYLQIDIQKYVPLQTYRSVPGDGKRYVTGNNFTNRAGRRTSQNLTTKPLINDGTILLPIPSDLKDVNSVKYDSSSINGLEAIGAEGTTQLSNFLSQQVNNIISGKFDGNAAMEEATSIVGGLAGDVRDGAGTVDAIKNYFDKRLASQIISVFGGNVSPSDLLARGNGEIFNPNMELLFGGPTLRNFRFQFKLTPRNEKEAEQCKLIIRAFKRNMAAQAEGGISQNGNFFLKTPNVFKLRYRSGNRNHPFLNRFKQCFLSDMTVSYTGEGIYSTYEDGTPVSMILDLSFKETQPVYDIDYDERPGTQAVGY